MRKLSLPSLFLILAVTLLKPCDASAAPQTISYVGESFGYSLAFLIEPTAPGQVRVVDDTGSAEGSVQTTGSKRLVTLSQPLISLGTQFDSCAESFTLRQETNSLLIRQISGSVNLGKSEIVRMGTLTYIGGCQDGKTTTFGSPKDPGWPVLNRAMSKREGMEDLVPSVQLAGMKEGVSGLPPFGNIAADVVTFLPGARLRFATTKTTVPIQRTSDGWLLLPLSGTLRGYTRLVTDPVYGAERWLEATFVDGVVTNVRSAMMVKPVAGASFGTVREASRRWESSLFVGTSTPFYVDLHKDGTGERIITDLDYDYEQRTPITWAFDGLNIVQELPAGLRIRTWEPLASDGKVRFVMESETMLGVAGQEPYIQPRVNFYIDRGQPVPADPASRRGPKGATAARAVSAAAAATQGLHQ